MSYSGQRQSSRSVEEGLMLWGVIFLFLAAGALFLWWRFHAEVAGVVIAVEHWQMGQIARFTDGYAALDAQVANADPASVKFGALWRLLHNVGSFFRWPVAGVLGLLAVVCFFRAAPARFTRAIDLPRLMQIQAEVFPSGAAYVGRGLKLVPLQEGTLRPCDPALHTRDWVLRFAAGPDGTLDLEKARDALSLQLGPAWSGLGDASPQVRCLFAAFALHTARQRDEAVAFLGVLSSSLPIDAGDGPSGPAAPLRFGAAAVARADRILSDAHLIKPCLLVADRHAFTAPALMSVLTLARQQAGVLAPAQFAFLKLVDRPLWYALHALGFPGGQNPAEQPNPRIEAVGARDHWAAECDFGQKLRVPSLDRSLAVVRKQAIKDGLTLTTQPGDLA